jgi:hypothetical protein
MNVLRAAYLSKTDIRRFAAYDMDDENDMSFLDTIQEQEVIRQARAGIRRSRMMKHDQNM